MIPRVLVYEQEESICRVTSGDCDVSINPRKQGRSQWSTHAILARAFRQWGVN